jgi:glycosyltransferase involved in cell wall biosynthesis
MKKVLLVTDVNFWEKCSGHRMRISALIEYLAHHVQLTVVNTGPAPQDIEEILRNSFNADFFVLEKTKYLNSNGYGRKLKTFLKDKKFDTIIIEYIHSSYFLNFLIDDVKIILDAHDIISDRADEFKKFNYSSALYEISKEDEFEIMNVYDHVMVLCEPDYEKVNSMIGQGRALLCPHPVMICRHPVRTKVKSITFIASGYLPNKDAINFFIANCWPQITEIYDITLSVYGTVGEGLDLPKNNRIAWKGFVPDLNKIYEEADIIINPIRFGAGLKIKNVEALAHGLPLVTTTHGARGIETGINNAFLVADEPSEFIHSIASLIENVKFRTHLSKNARKLIADRFSAEKCFDPLLAVINI